MRDPDPYNDDWEPMVERAQLAEAERDIQRLHDQCLWLQDTLADYEDWLCDLGPLQFVQRRAREAQERG